MTSPDAPHTNLTPEEQEQIELAGERLAQEFAGVFGPETVDRYLASSCGELTRRATFTMWLPVLIERVTRDRLRAIARTELGNLERPAVLFLCTHNAGRSQMAAGWMRLLAGDRVEVFSGGTDPTGALHDAVVESMAEVGIDVSDQLPQPWTDEVALAADVIVTMGCGDACPVFEGKRYEDWDLHDPISASLDDVRQLRDAIRSRVETLLVSLTTSNVGGAR